MKLQSGSESGADALKYRLSLFLLLVVLWLGNSGLYSFLLLGFGLASVIFVIWVSHCLGVVDQESQPLHLARRLPKFFGWLIVKIIRSNIDVVRLIWLGNRAISPCSTRLPLGQKSDLGRVIYANAITLTPGTVAMDMDDDTVLVHALTREGIEDLQEGEMRRRVAELER